MLSKNTKFSIYNSLKIKIDSIRLQNLVTYYDISEVDTILKKNRIIFCTGEINDLVSNTIVNHLVYFSSLSDKDAIKFIINSPGGNISSGLAIYDAITISKLTLNTYSIGISASIGCFLLCIGSPNRRFSFPNSRIMIHQPFGGIQGTPIDIEIQTKELIIQRSNLNYLIACHTNNSIEKIEKDTDFEKYFTPHEALRYGIIDKILIKKNKTIKKLNCIDSLYYPKAENINWPSIKKISQT
uniref:ATP-dependent Clp protease proteolytic subunit n=1 Tax=Gymnochlora stellata TaxID=67809 RepID=B5A4F2_GYMST|nr:chloroplast ATP-dependent Clp protease proteolytic subunit 2 [Gymnochlora stellata]